MREVARLVRDGGRETVGRAYGCIFSCEGASLPQSATLTAPSSEGASEYQCAFVFIPQAIVVFYFLFPIVLCGFGRIGDVSKNRT